MTTRITPGIDGKEKQSKSLGIYIALAHSPRDKYGRVMKIPDEMILSYFEVYSTVPRETNPSQSPPAGRNRLPV